MKKNAKRLLVFGFFSIAIISFVLVSVLKIVNQIVDKYKEASILEDKMASLQEEEKDENMVEESSPDKPREVETEVVDAPKDKKGKKKKSKARVIIEWILTGLFGVLFVTVLVGQIDGMIHANDHYGQQIRLGFGSFVVLTDSMEPEYMMMKSKKLRSYCM